MRAYIYKILHGNGDFHFVTPDMFLADEWVKDHGPVTPVVMIVDIPERFDPVLTITGKIKVRLDEHVFRVPLGKVLVADAYGYPEISWIDKRLGFRRSVRLNEVE